jgi:6-pyruvoyl-tetrahydropterin synthase
MTRAEFTRRFSAAHRLAGDPSECERIHGHNYEAEIVVTLNSPLDPDVGMVVPAQFIKREVDEKYDHRLILEQGDAFFKGYPEDHDPDIHRVGETPIMNLDAHHGWVVYLPYAPTTENLAAKIAMDVRDAVKAFHAGERLAGTVDVFLKETPTITAHVRVSLR